MQKIKKEEAKNIIPGAEKMLCVMERLAEGEAGLSQLMTQTATSMTTCYRILQTLVSHGWIYRTLRGKYAVSAGFALIARRCTENYWERCRKNLILLSENTGLTSKLSIREGMDQVMVMRQESPHPFGVSLKEGIRFALPEGTVGAALVCSEKDDEIERIWTKCQGTLPAEETLSVLKRRVREMRNRRWSLRNNIGGRGTSAMSTPVMGWDGKILAALTVLGTRTEFSDSQRIAEILIQTAAELSQLMEQE